MITFDIMITKEEKTLSAHHPVVLELLKRSSWYKGNERNLLAASFATLVPVYGDGMHEEAWISIIKLDYLEGQSDRYFFPFLVVTAEKKPYPGALALPEGRWLADALESEQFRRTMYERAIADQNVAKQADLKSIPAKDLEAYAYSELLNNCRSNSAFIVNEKYFCKVFRRLHIGQNTEAEVLRHLMYHTGFQQAPRYYTAWEISCVNEWDELQDSPDDAARHLVMAVFQKIENRSNAWNIFTEYASNFFRQALNENLEVLTDPETARIAEKIINENFGAGLFTKIERIACITAEMHQALAENPGRMFEFAVEPLKENKGLLTAGMRELLSGYREAPEGKALREEVSAKKSHILFLLTDIMKEAGELSCIRIHGDYHLGQLLWDGDNFFVIDFEGEHNIPFHMRRARFPVHKDLAGILRSFSQSAHTVLLNMDREVHGISSLLKPFAQVWIKTIHQRFLSHYSLLMENTGLIYASEKENLQMLDFFMLNKVVAENEEQTERMNLADDIHTGELRQQIDDFVS